jgi:hypothetical protein
VTSNTITELVEYLGKFFLRQIQRTSVNMNNTKSGFHVDELGLIL